MKNNEKDRCNFAGIMTTCLVYGVLSVLLAMLFVLLFSALISKEILPSEFVGCMAYSGVFLSSMISCFFATKSRGKVLLTSLIQGVSNLIMYYIMGLLIFMKIIPSNMCHFNLIACILGAIVGGIASAILTPARRTTAK